MLDIRQIKNNTKQIKKQLSIRGNIDISLIDKVIELDVHRASIQQELDNLLAQMNILSKDIGLLYKTGKKDEAYKAKEQTSLIKEKSKKKQEEHKAIAKEIESILVRIPNVPHELVPKGESDEDNQIIQSSNVNDFLHSSQSIPHWELAKKYNLFDLDLGVKITGAGFPLYRGKGARLQRALIQFFLDQAIDAGYEEILAPHLVNEQSAFGTGQLPDKEGQMYEMQLEPYFLIPTAEVPITNIYRDVILKASDFPIKMTGYTPCFRREAGSYGKNVRGLNRVHQFDKVELVRIEHPSNSYQALEDMIKQVRQLLEKLKLPYRILRLCGGDLGFTSAITYDFEVYSIAQKRWLEVSSVSNFETFQSNRLKIRFKQDGKNYLAHTLNGSALALPRIMAALLENHQTKDGIHIPEVLVPYTGFSKID